jgi:hypothetical protein
MKSNKEKRNSQKENNKEIIFWNNTGIIAPSTLYKFFESKGVYQYYHPYSDKKNEAPIIVKVTNNVISEVNDSYLINLAKDHIMRNHHGSSSNTVMDSLHSSTVYFNSKNKMMLPFFDKGLLKDTKDCSYLFFKNGVMEITSDNIQLKKHEELTGYIWKDSIVDHDFEPVSLESIAERSHFYDFLQQITKVKDEIESNKRFESLLSIIGYLIHRYKDPTITKAIILMDVSHTGAQGRTGKTLICQAVKKVRNMKILDGKEYDPRRPFRYSNVEYDTDILVFDDLQKNFDFEQLYSAITTGLSVEKKYKDKIFIPFESSPKLVLTTNYAIAGDGSSYRGRTFEFEISNTFNAEYQPTEMYGKRFFDDWNEYEWNDFYNLLAYATQFFLKYGLVQSQPINLRLTKLIHQTSEDFVEFAKEHIEPGVRYDKQQIHNRFMHEYPDYRDLEQRHFTIWLKKWGDYIGARVDEPHSNNIRTITYVLRTTS